MLGSPNKNTISQTKSMRLLVLCLCFQWKHLARMFPLNVIYNHWSIKNTVLCSFLREVAHKAKKPTTSECAIRITAGLRIIFFHFTFSTFCSGPYKVPTAACMTHLTAVSPSRRFAAFHNKTRISPLRFASKLIAGVLDFKDKIKT